MIKKTNCPPDKILIELTESFVMNDSPKFLDKLIQISKIGIKIAIDDFGTGYSSFSYLKQLPVNILKMDKSFIRDIPDNQNDIEISRAIIKLGDVIKLDVIAEGVETVSQSELLKNEGCKLQQGYLFSHPLKAEEIEKFFTKE